MIKKIGYVVGVSALIAGCTMAVKQPDRQVAVAAFEMESEEVDSNKGLTLETDPVTTPELKVKKDDGTLLDCNKLGYNPFTLKGVAYKKLKLTDSAALKCPNVKVFNFAMPWKVKKTEWSAEDEKGYSDFVRVLGSSKCNNTDICLSSEKSNPLISEEDMKTLYYADCADLPYVIRAYYAYKKGLPFSFVSQTGTIPLSQIQIDEFTKKREAAVLANSEKDIKDLDKKLANADARSSINGNQPLARYNIPNLTGDPRDFAKIKIKINDSISSGTFRMHNGDYYSPKVNAKNIKPGTAVYGPKGHVALVYGVKANGDIEAMDAHPGNSITYKGWIDDEFIMSRTAHASLFKVFRPVKVLSPVRNAEGTIVSGKVVMAQDSELPEFSMEQFDSKNFTHDGRAFPLKEWVRLRLTGGSYRTDPIDEIKTYTESLCVNFKDRVDSVQGAINAGLNKSSINQYPKNIFSAHGSWEDFASPSSDLRRRTGTLAVIASAKDSVRRYNAKDKMFSYKGTNLKADMLKAYQDVAKSCTITYKNSAGANVTLNLDQLARRVGVMSFDPYMCPELRWGASGSELATCPDGPEKREFYKLTQFLRNNNEKDNNALHGYTLDDLRRIEVNKSEDNRTNAINYDIAAQLLAL